MEIITISLASVNCYLLKHDGASVLIDTGFALKRKSLEGELEKNGCAEGTLKLIILTHSDSDHTANAKYLRDTYKTKIAMHANDVIGVQTGKLSAVRKIPNNLSGFMMKAVIGLVSLPKKDRFTPDILYTSDTDESALGVPLSIVTLPGHTFGSIGIAVNGTELICGDFLINPKKPKKGMGIHDLDEFSKNLEKLRKMGIETIYPGHGKSFRLGDCNVSDIIK